MPKAPTIGWWPWSEASFVCPSQGEGRLRRAADRELFGRIAAGRINPMTATLRGVVEARGDLTLLVRFQRLFPGPRAPTSTRVPTAAGTASRRPATTALEQRQREGDPRRDGPWLEQLGRRDEGKPADVLVVFGITGDLAKVMTFRSLYRLERRGLLDCPIVGVAVDDWTQDQLVDRARESIEGTGEALDPKVFDRFKARLSYVAGRLRRCRDVQAGRRRRSGGAARRCSTSRSRRSCSGRW